MIRERSRALCEFCKQELDVTAQGNYQYASGWAKNRIKGLHGLSLQKREWKWAHGHCVERMVSGHFNQTDIFDAPAEPPPPDEASPPTNASVDASGHLLHRCNVCGGEASFGIGVGLRKGDLGLWYCFAHLPSEEKQSWQEPGEDPAPSEPGVRF